MSNIIAPIVLDLSHHNEVGKDGFLAMREFGVWGIIHKATQGASFVDPDYARRRDAALAAGMLWGAYHFGDDSDPAEQSDHFLEVARADKDTLLALDLEPNGSRTMSVGSGVSFLNSVTLHDGRLPALYAGFYTLDAKATAQQEATLGQHRLWLAAYNDKPKTPRPWRSPWLWQFSGDGRNAHGIRVPGVSLGVDMNTYGGSLDELRASWSGTNVLDLDADSAARDASNSVAALQAMLSTRGFNPGRIDGIIGPATVKAVQRWGGFKGRDVDGVVGVKTRPVLDRALSLSKT